MTRIWLSICVYISLSLVSTAERVEDEPAKSYPPSQESVGRLLDKGIPSRQVERPELPDLTVFRNAGLRLNESPKYRKREPEEGQSFGATQVRVGVSEAAKSFRGATREKRRMPPAEILAGIADELSPARIQMGPGSTATALSEAADVFDTKLMHRSDSNERRKKRIDGGAAAGLPHLEGGKMKHLYRHGHDQEAKEAG